MAELTEERFDRVGIYEIYRVASNPCAWGPRATEIMAMFRLRPHSSDDTAFQGACGRAAPGSLEPRRYASRPSGFDPSRKDFMSPSPGAVGPGSRRTRRRYADPPAAALLTGLGAALGSRAAFGVAMLTRPGCLLSSGLAGSASAFMSPRDSGARKPSKRCVRTSPAGAGSAIWR
jgi:hypothetical protein